MNTWTILKVCCSIPSLLCFAVFVEKPTSCLSQLPVHCSKLSPIGAFSLLCCVYYVDTEFNLLFLDCSSPQWKWRRDPRQQTIYWVFWSGWWSWRGVLSHVKVVEWGQKKKKEEWLRRSEVAFTLVSTSSYSSEMQQQWEMLSSQNMSCLCCWWLLQLCKLNMNQCVKMFFLTPPFLFLWVHFIQWYEI